jgi:hypothetical protein
LKKCRFSFCFRSYKTIFALDLENKFVNEFGLDVKSALNV